MFVLLLQLQIIAAIFVCFYIVEHSILIERNYTIGLLMQVQIQTCGVFFFHVQSVDIYSLLQQLRWISVRAHKNTTLQLLSDSGETSVKVCCQMPK